MSRRQPLVDDHETLDTILEDVWTLVHDHEVNDIEQIWSDFREIAERHLDYEEQEVFARCLPLAPSVRRVVEELAEEHDAIRRLSRSIGQPGRPVQIAEIDELSALMRRHARREEATLYRWLDTLD